MAKGKILTIKCPNCKKNIALDEVFTKQIKSEMQKEFEEELSEKEKEVQELKKSMNQQIEEALESQKVAIERKAKKKAAKSLELEMKNMQEQINEQKEDLKKAQEQELKLRKEQRKLEEDKKKFELNMQRKLDEEKEKIFEEAVKKVDEEHELKDKERQKQMDDLKKQIEEWKRKAEQGSQKLQGEILELELEDVLRDAFTQDQIEAISSGVQGADILQKVCSRNGKICGSILIESKRTKNWSNGWIAKLKEDQREAKADLAVLATTTLPDGVDNFECRDGVIIIHHKMIIPITFLLRNQLIEITKTKSLNSAMNEKIDSLYTYLTGTEFKQRVESIVEAFANMMNELQREKRAMIKIWAKREKQIEQAFKGIAGMYGGMQGILGSSMPEIKQLEMTELTELEDVDNGVDVTKENKDIEDDEQEVLDSKKTRKHYNKEEIEEMENKSKRDDLPGWMINK